MRKVITALAALAALPLAAGHLPAASAATLIPTGAWTGVGAGESVYSVPLNTTLANRGFNAWAVLSGYAGVLGAINPPALNSGIQGRTACDYDGSTSAQFPYPFGAETVIGGNGTASLVCNDIAFTLTGTVNWLRVGAQMVFSGNATMQVNSSPTVTGIVAGTVTLVPEGTTMDRFLIAMTATFEPVRVQ